MVKQSLIFVLYWLVRRHLFTVKCWRSGSCRNFPFSVWTCPQSLTTIYWSRLQSSWTHLITPSRNSVEVRWRSLFRNTSLGKRCTSYNAPLTSRKRAADRWSLRNFLPRSSLFIVRKAQKSHGTRSELNSVFGLENWIGGTPLGHPPYSPMSRPMRFLGFSSHEKGAPRKKISK
jgi:hypothetical protein